MYGLDLLRNKSTRTATTKLYFDDVVNNIVNANPYNLKPHISDHVVQIFNLKKTSKEL